MAHGTLLPLGESVMNLRLYGWGEVPDAAPTPAEVNCPLRIDKRKTGYKTYLSVVPRKVESEQI